MDKYIVICSGSYESSACEVTAATPAAAAEKAAGDFYGYDGDYIVIPNDESIVFSVVESSRFTATEKKSRARKKS